MIIAVDGPAAAGKGTIAKALAQHLSYHHLDTGTLYRRVGLELLKSDGDIHDSKVAAAIAQNLHSYAYLDYELRTEAVGAAASIVASIPEVLPSRSLAPCLTAATLARWFAPMPM
jgi:CMP/dCMP kinase